MIDGGNNCTTLARLKHGCAPTTERKMMLGNHADAGAKIAQQTSLAVVYQGLASAGRGRYPRCPADLEPLYKRPGRCQELRSAVRSRAPFLEQNAPCLRCLDLHGASWGGVRHQLSGRGGRDQMDKRWSEATPSISNPRCVCAFMRRTPVSRTCSWVPAAPHALDSKMLLSMQSYARNGQGRRCGAKSPP